VVFEIKFSVYSPILQRLDEGMEAVRIVQTARYVLEIVGDFLEFHNESLRR
jgi:hypothetical protein